MARRLGCPVAIGGGEPAGARIAAERLLDQGATGLLSFGLAGGLDPALPAGRLVVPRAILAGTDRFAVDPALLGWLGEATAELLLAADRVAADALGKQALWRATGAVAVDLESAAVARAAAARGVPFAVLRAICDPAGRDLPPAAILALDRKGRIGLARVAASVLRRPGQLPGLLALASDASRARRALVAHVAAMLAR